MSTRGRTDWFSPRNYRAHCNNFCTLYCIRVPRSTLLYSLPLAEFSASKNHLLRVMLVLLLLIAGPSSYSTITSYNCTPSTFWHISPYGPKGGLLPHMRSVCVSCARSRRISVFSRAQWLIRGGKGKIFAGKTSDLIIALTSQREREKGAYVKN